MKVNDSVLIDEFTNARKEINYNTRDYPIDFLVTQLQSEEFYIPYEYQRNFIWDDTKKSLFIESILLGLPIPMMFFSDTVDNRCEILDGAQRTQTLEAFLDNNLKLKNLKKLKSFEGLRYDDLPVSIQARFKKTNIRVVVLAPETTLEIRQEIFSRINTSGVTAKPAEIRRGKYMQEEFMDFIRECSQNETLIRLCPLSKILKDRFELEELVLRFFAYLYNYQKFSKRVDKFLDSFIEENIKTFTGDKRKEYFKEFTTMLNFVEKYFPNGFAKDQQSHITPRVRFEAISVGVALALRENPNLTISNVDWLESDDFQVHTTTHASNSKKRVAGRIEYVKDMLLK